ncbi:MAG: sulfatase-like hydrolase/transferase [Bacteroidales bacterium]|nr:sulfatase-like hydrolase/transferase [Bacteroidales bacterium]
MKLRNTPFSNIVAVVANLAIVYAVYMITRWAYIMENWNIFAPTWDALSSAEVLCGSLRFDSSAIFYTNALWIVLMLLPLHVKERPWWHTMCKVLFLVVNTVGLSANLADAVYSQYTGRRTTWTFFSEFSNEGNLGSIFFVELGRHWYFLVLGVVLLLTMHFLYVKPRYSPQRPLWRYYVVQAAALIIMAVLSVGAMRGGFTKAVRPITISNANQYVNTPTESAIVLNTPFSMIRTAGKTPFADPQYMDDAELDSIYTPLHAAADSVGPLHGRNVVVLIVESFGREYIGFYNRTLDGGNYRGFTPFADSLLAHSLTWEHTFANGRKSIDGMPSILSSIPMFVEPFFLTTSSLNDVGGLAASLGAEGYSTAFFHGADNGSMGFQAFARTTGFQRYYGRTEYDADTRFGAEADFDGTWAIWDEPFLQFYALTMTDMPEPFMTAVFTASSHHPFNIPDQYRDIYPEEQPLPMYKCIRYTDNALRRFFQTASRQPWYENTLFVLTSDHTNMSAHDEYRTSLGVFSAPILIFDPSGTLPRGIQPGVAQQIDIMPTLLSLLGIRAPYIAFGKDLLGRPADDWAVNYAGGIYQYILGDYVLLFDGSRPTALYNYAADPLQQSNLLGTMPDLEAQMTRSLEAVIQSYMQRMTSNRLVAR